MREYCAAAQAAGDLSAEHVDVIVRALGPVTRRGYDPVDVSAGEEILVGYAHSVGPEDLRRLAHQVVDAIDPDGSEPDDEVRRERRSLELTRSRDGSCWFLRGRLTNDLGAKLKSVLEPLAKPRRDTEAPSRLSAEPSGDLSDSAERRSSPVDTRSREQRMHDALEELSSSVLTRGETPGPGGTGIPATLVITVRLEDLIERCGHGWTSDGTRLPLDTILEQVTAAEILPAFLTRSGALLGVGDLGRNRRIASRAQSLALTARDGGCSFPGCERDSQWCERHHIVAWIDGGATNLDNLTLLCRYHHHNFAAKGWTCALNADGLPEWTPPRWSILDGGLCCITGSGCSTGSASWRCPSRPCRVGRERNGRLRYPAASPRTLRRHP